MQLPLDFTFSFEKDIAKDDVSRSVIEVAEEVNINNYVNLSNRDSHGYDGVMMFKLVVLSRTLFGRVSTRELSSLCRNDLRFIFIAQGQKPSHQSFQLFISDDLKMSVEDIFFDINKYIETKIEINKDVLFIDGTKYEANANKNTFIWRKNTIKNREKCWKKAISLIQRINRFCEKENINVRYSLLREPSIDYLLCISDKIEDYMKDNHIEFVHGKGKRKSSIQKLYDELKNITLKMWEYTIHLDMLNGRNSCSKTDPDATFMHMKYDYYNHTNVFKPGYNVQIGVSDGFIRNIYVSSDCNDLKTYIPFMEKYKQAYGNLPSKTPADAGYGSYDNYSYCKENNIDLYMKHSGYYKDKEKTNDKNRFQTKHLERSEDGGFICPAGHAFEVEKEVEDSRSIYKKVNTIYVNKHCEGCPLRSQCTKSKTGRTINHCHQLEEFHKEVNNNVTSKEGIELMHKRSNETEGTFGDWKANHNIEKLRYRGETGVRMELILIAIGHNIRKYHQIKMKLEQSKVQQAN